MSYKLHRIGLFHVNGQCVAYRPNKGHAPFIEICPKNKFYSWCKKLLLEYPKEEGWKISCMHNIKIEQYLANYITQLHSTQYYYYN